MQETMIFERDGIRIHHAEYGDPDGPAVLLIAPGGLRSAIDAWGRSPWDPRTELTGYRVIAMDQRNAGASTGPICAGWADYTADQLALMSHLGIDRFHVVGMCIGGPYILGLCRAAPERVRSAVMLQPIGLDNNRDAFYELFDGWASNLRDKATEAEWASFRHDMFGGDFLFNTTRAQAAAVTTPILLLMGDDTYHPAPVSRELARLLPHVTFIERWKDQPAETGERIRAFLA